MELPYEPKRPDDFMPMLIGEMSKEDMIAELLSHQRLRFGELETVNLRTLVVDARMSAYHRRLIAEARLQHNGGMFGGYSTLDGEEDSGGDAQRV